VLLIAGAGGIGLAILLLAGGLLQVRSSPRGVAGALAPIERNYGQEASPPAGRRGRAAGVQLPGWASTLAIRLSPSGFAARLQRQLDVAGNPAAWTADRILAAKGVGCWSAGCSAL
jgi:tight adherence protein C